MVRVRYDNPEPAQPPDEFQSMLRDFETCGLFAEPTYDTTRSKPQFKIDISPEDDKKAPYRPPYRLSPKEDAELQRQLDKAIRNGWIRPSNSHYGSPVLFVPKKDGGLRMCIDYRAVNRITRKDRYPLPHIEELVQPLGGSTCFSKIDLASGYHQIRICAADRQKTAFSTKYGLYEWTVLPFGLANAPSQFMRVMNRLLASNPELRKFVAVYLDDVLIHSSTREEHLDHVRTVLQLLQKAGLKLKKSKCEWFCDEIEFCGFHINQKGVHTSDSKTRAVTEWPRPRNTKEVRGFLCLTSYYRKFI